MDELTDRALAASSLARFTIVKAGLYDLVDRRAKDTSLQAWTDPLEHVLTCVPLDEQAQQRLLQTITWRARTHGLGDPLGEETGRAFADAGKWVLYCSAYFRRFEFKFQELHHLTHHALAAHPDEVMFEVFSAFGALGVNDATIAEEVPALFERVKSNPAALDTLLHGVWLSTDVLEDRDEWVLTISRQSMRLGDRSANVYFWRSSALRATGRYAEALESIDEALARHTLRDNHVHQDYVRERELIRAMQSIARMVALSAEEATRELNELHRRQLAEAQAEFRAKALAVEDSVSKSLTGVVEILGVFLALLGFLAGTGYLVLNVDHFWSSLAAFGVLALGSLAFIVALRLIVRPRA